MDHLTSGLKISNVIMINVVGDLLFIISVTQCCVKYGQTQLWVTHQRAGLFSCLLETLVNDTYMLPCY